MNSKIKDITVLKGQDLDAYKKCESMKDLSHLLEFHMDNGTATVCIYSDDTADVMKARFDNLFDNTIATLDKAA